MLALLAQIQRPAAPSTPGPGFFDGITLPEIPTQAEYLAQLFSLPSLLAGLLVACGVLYLLQGWKAFKTLVVLNAAVLGIVLGQRIGMELGGGDMAMYAALAGGLLLAVLAWPLMKYSVGLMGALAGGFLGYGLWQFAVTAAGRENLAEYSWVGALVGLIIMGLLSFVVFRFVIIVFTTFQGSLMIVSGLLSLLLKYDRTASTVNYVISYNKLLLPLIIITPALMGFVAQQTAAVKKSMKKKKAMEGKG